MQTFFIDAPDLYEEVKTDMERAGVYLLDVIEGSVVISFAVRGNQTFADILRRKIEGYRGQSIVLHSGEYGNITLGINHLNQLQNASFATTAFYTTLSSETESKTSTAETEETNGVKDQSHVMSFIVLCISFSFY